MSEHTSDAGRLHVVVTPSSAINPRTGAGQRTRLFFDACLANGPTELVVIGPKVDADWVVEHFPGVRKVHVLPPVGQVMRARNPILRKFNGVRLLLSPVRAYASDPQFTRTLAAIVGDAPQALVLFRYARTYCAAELDGFARPGVHVAVDVDDRDDQKYTSTLNRALGSALTRTVFGPTSLRRLSQMLQARLSQTDMVWFAAAEDVWDLEPGETGVIPNVAMVDADLTELPPPSNGADILFVGSFRHMPNQLGVRWFLQQCWPRIRAVMPDARIRVVGMGDWASLAPTLPDPHGVDLVGPVDDLTVEYARARLAISPINEGGGSKIKIIEAAKYGRPVVIVPHSARGFEADFVAHLRIAETPDAFAQACIALLQDPAGADREGAALANLEATYYARAGLLERLATEIRNLR